MKITIDTKEDSKDEIKKVISLLKNMLDEPVSNVNIFEDKKTQQSAPSGLFNIFGSNDKESSETKVTKTATSTDDLLKETNIIEEKEELKKDNLKLEPY